ncbi:MAG: DNA polymerase III subunit chi [Pseudomonadota bacterium]
MTRIDFYVLDQPSRDQHDRLICQIVEKAWKTGHKLYIRCADATQVHGFDELLWTFKDTSFLPHAVDKDANQEPIVVGVDGEQAVGDRVLVNMAHEVPDFFSRFERIVESAGFDEVSRAAARAKYKFYKTRGFALETHRIGAR